MISIDNKQSTKRRRGEQETLPLGDAPPIIPKVVRKAARRWRLPPGAANVFKSLRQGISRATRWAETLHYDGGIVILFWAGTRRKSIVIDLRGKQKRPAGPVKTPEPEPAASPVGNDAPEDESPQHVAPQPASGPTGEGRTP